MNYALSENIVISVIKENELGKSCTEADVSGLSFPEIENVRYKLMDRGYRVEIYKEFKSTYIGVWFK